MIRTRKITNIVPVIFTFVVIAVLAFLITDNMKETEAADMSKFDAGYIMSDYVMSNYNSMTEAEIQAFLKSKNSCDDSNFDKIEYASLTYHVENGHYVCLADDLFPDEYVAEPSGLQPKPTTGETAAHIIWQAAQDYQINPQVLIVLLQKEQGLITDTWPNTIQYRAATGYGCPDTSVCSSVYYGFKNQVRRAAELFRVVLNGGWTNYPLGNNYVKYNPNSSCGGTVINIRSLATSALYRYTPYQPNAAALATSYSGGDSCSAYGNRNFYSYFSDWFGDPTAEDSARQEIEKRYEKIGGENIMGQTINGINCYEDEKNQDYCVQAYENGIIVYNEKTGAWENYGNIRKKYVELGSINSVLGFPTGAINGYMDQEGNDYYVQAYENGIIVQKNQDNAYENYGDIRTHYINQGSVGGNLGFPTSGINCYKDEYKQDYCVQAYDNGVIISNKYGIIENSGLIRERYLELGSTEGLLGFPISNSNCYTDHTNQNYCVQAYENGIIIANKYGAYENYGEIRKRFINNGSVDGFFGQPMSGIVIENEIAYQIFEKGTIVKDSKDNYWVTNGEIAKKYQSKANILGGAIMNVNNNIGRDGAAVQAFEGGVIIYSKEYGAWENYGEIRKKFIEAGTVGSEYGFPTSGIECVQSVCVQKFENGKISN